MQKGTQIKRYIEDNYEEYGFVTSAKSKSMLVVFWDEKNNRKLKSYTPEPVPLKELEKFNLHDQSFVDRVIQEMGY